MCHPIIQRDELITLRLVNQFLMRSVLLSLGYLLYRARHENYQGQKDDKVDSRATLICAGTWDITVLYSAISGSQPCGSEVLMIGLQSECSAIDDKNEKNNSNIT